MALDARPDAAGAGAGSFSHLLELLFEPLDFDAARLDLDFEVNILLQRELDMFRVVLLYVCVSG